MKKIVMIILSAGLCGICGIICGSAIEQILPEGAGPLQFLVLMAVMILLFYLSFLVQTAIHEGGHYLFGKLTGYSFVSYRFADLMWKRENGRVALKRFSLAGTGGQCLMEPPGNIDDDVPFVLYNMGGVILNTVTACIFLFIGLQIKGPFLRAFVLMLAAAGIYQALLNGLPAVSTVINNDGTNTLEMMRDKKVMRPFMIQLKITAQSNDGVRLKDMPAEWFRLPAPQEMDNAITASLGIMAENRLMDEHRFHEAAQLARILINEAKGLMKLHEILLKEDLVFLSLISEDETDVNEIRTDQFMKELRSVKDSLAVIRTEYAYALFHDDQEEAERLLKKFEKTSLNYPYTAEAESERELIRYAQGYDSLMRKKQSQAA